MGLAFPVIQGISFACYLVASFLYISGFLGEAPKKHSLASYFLLAGVLLQLSLLFLITGAESALPLRTVREALLVASVFIGCSYFLFERATGEKTVGPFIVPFPAILSLSSLILCFFPRPQLEPEVIFTSAWFQVHVLLTLLSYAAFAFAFSTGLMYFMLSHEIAVKRMGRVFVRLPSLDSLDHIGYRAVSIGFPLLTLGVVAGGLWAERVWGSFFRMEIKEVWTFATWIIYAAYLHSRLAAGWQGKRAALLSIVGFLACMLSFVGGSLLPGRHNF
ncbi:MAG: cytochrome c biogenesis protein CcsA [Candidatus Eisenbacteria bacterium]|nr:cytochrome c biogenesis protein CcsA [Candidatus Eisenbacteria bacterium]